MEKRTLNPRNPRYCVNLRGQVVLVPPDTPHDGFGVANAPILKVGDGAETILLPATNALGEPVSGAEALAAYKLGGQHFGRFDSEKDADDAKRAYEEGV